MIPDDTIIQSVKGGHLQDFEEVVHRYEQKIFHFIYKMIYREEDARNLTQETFLKVFRHIGKYRCDGKFSAFIHRVAKNLVINYIKKENRKSNFSQLPDRQTENILLVDHNTPARELEAEEKMTRLKDAMSGLGASQRIALSYKFHFDYSYRQIAEITGWSIPKIETLIHRAKKKLISRLNLQEKTKKTVNSPGEMP